MVLAAGLGGAPIFAQELNATAKLLVKEVQGVIDDPRVEVKPEVGFRSRVHGRTNRRGLGKTSQRPSSLRRSGRQ